MFITYIRMLLYQNFYCTKGELGKTVNLVQQDLLKKLMIVLILVIIDFFLNIKLCIQ